MTTTTTLKALREARGLSQRDLASRLDVSAAYLCRMEDGKAPMRHEHARSAARALKTSETALMAEHEAEVDFIKLEASLEVLKNAELPEIVATPRGRRVVQEFIHRCFDLSSNDALSPSLKSQAAENAEFIASAVTKATEAAATLVVTKRREVDDAATKALGGFGETDRSGPRHRDIFGRVREHPDLPRDLHGRRIRNVDGVAIHELNPDPDDERPAGRVAADSQTRRDVSSDYYRQGKSATKARAEKNYVKGSVDWARSEIEKQLDTTDAAGARAYGVFVREMFVDRAIVQNDADNTIKEYPWSFSDGDESVTLGDPVEVELDASYEPAAKAGDGVVLKRDRRPAMSKSMMKELGRDVLGRRIRDEQPE